MKHCVARTALLGLLLSTLVACNTTTQTRFEINPLDNPSTPSTEDRDAVKDVLAGAATELRLKDFTATSIVPETIVFYQQSDTSNPLKVIAWVEDSRIFVDVLQFPSEPGESMLYQRARNLVQRELTKRFGERSAVVNFRALDRPAPSDAR